MSNFENGNYDAPWNDVMHRDDPFAPWNDPVHRDDPFAPWNSPLSDKRDYDRWERQNRTGWRTRGCGR